MHQGILLEQCFDNSILQNNITGNLGYGIALLSSSNNTFCHNNITDSAHACGRHVFGKQEEQLVVLVGWIKLCPKPNQNFRPVDTWQKARLRLFQVHTRFRIHTAFCNFKM
jgi:parallel beta-helix repeat protein